MEAPERDMPRQWVGSRGGLVCPLMEIVAVAVVFYGCKRVPPTERSGPITVPSASTPSAPRASRENEYGKVIAWLAQRGVVPRPDRALVVGLRGRDLSGAPHETRIERAHDDTLVVLTPDRRVLRFAASTHPWEVDGGAGVPDVDGDGRPDVGMIRPGRYLAVRRAKHKDIRGVATYRVLLGDEKDGLPAFRNTDRDDRYSPEEQKRSIAEGHAATAILFHASGFGEPRAVGCQVLEPAAMSDLAAAAGERFDYVLVEASEGPAP